MQPSSAYTGPQEEPANWADTRFTKSATGSADAAHEDWRQRHLEVQRGDFPQAISRSSCTWLDHEEFARACALSHPAGFT